MPISRDNFSRRYSVVADTRRQWSDAEKQAIVAEAARPDVNISAVARRHGIKPSLLFRWRRMAREAEGRTIGSAFVPVTLALPPPEVEMPASPTAHPAGDAPECGAGTASRSNSGMAGLCGLARASTRMP